MKRDDVAKTSLLPGTILTFTEVMSRVEAFAFGGDVTEAQCFDLFH